ncbi:hypothetical protein BGZ47_005176 [Haplosporangium gracile]|nr:hypothetical protein BGZ47_005176 [Haplosporangium gracile]
MQQMNQHIQQNSQPVQGILQSIQRQTFELSEFTTPRLFIVLPTKEQGHFVNKFKIYFLCECDDHQGRIHRGDSQVDVANHGGYDLERPTEFFRKYSKQVVRCMNILKYVVMGAGLVVPAFAQVGLIEGLDSTSRLIQDISEDLAEKTDFVIEHLKDIGEHDATTSSNRHQSHVIGQDFLSSIELLTGPELRQLQTFLRAKNGDNVYANLHKIATPEGHVRWVCAHHRQEAERPMSMLTLHEFLTRAGGCFDTDTDALVVSLSTRQHARELYSLIRKFEFIHRLTVSFDWGIQESDLLELKDALATSSISHLNLCGKRYSDSWDPVLAIMAIPKLRVLSVKKFRGSLLNVTGWPKTIQLRSLDFSDQIITAVTAQKLIKACPNLVTLTLSTTDIKSTFDTVRRTAEQHGCLDTLTLKKSDPSQPSNADKPSVAYYFNKDQRTIRSATLTLRTQCYGDLIQLPMIKKVAYQPIAFSDQHVYEKAKQTALTLVKRFTEMENFEYQCHFNHFHDLFTAIKQQCLVIKEQPYQNSLLRSVKLIDEHGRSLTSKNTQDRSATGYNYEEASLLVQDVAPDPRDSGIQRDPHGTSRGTIGVQPPQELPQRAPIGRSVNYGRPTSTPAAAHIPIALPIYTAVDPMSSLPVLQTPSSLGDDGSRMRTMVLDSPVTDPHVREIYDSICSRGHSAFERIVWDITHLNNVRTLQPILTILEFAQRSNRATKLVVDIKIRLVSGICNSGGGGGDGGKEEGNTSNANQPGLSSLLDSADKSVLCNLFTTHVTRLKLFGRDLDLFLPRLCESYDWTMSELRELVVDGKSTHFSEKSLKYLQAIISRGPDVSIPGIKTLKPAQPLQQLIIQNMRLFDVQWSQLFTTIDWLTLHYISFRGSDFKLGQLVELETAVIQVVERCREKQRVLSLNGLAAKDAAMVQDLMVRQGGDACLLVSLCQTSVTVTQLREAQERLGELVRVKLTSHPSTASARYVFWGDLRMCFPGIVRIQHHDIYVPFMRGRKEYRYEELGITDWETTKGQDNRSATKGSATTEGHTKDTEELVHGMSRELLEELVEKQKAALEEEAAKQRAEEDLQRHLLLTQHRRGRITRQQQEITPAGSSSVSEKQPQQPQQPQQQPLQQQVRQLTEQEQKQVYMEKEILVARQTMKPAELQALEQALEQGKNPHDLIQDKIRELMQRIQIPAQKPGQQKVQKKVAKPVQKPTPKQVPGRLRDLVHIQVPEHMEGVDVDDLTIEEFIKLSNQTSTKQQQQQQQHQQQQQQQGTPNQDANSHSFNSVLTSRPAGTPKGQDVRGSEFNLAVDIFIEGAASDPLSGKDAKKLVEIPADHSIFKLIKAAAASSGSLTGTTLTANNGGESSTLGAMNTALEQALSQAILGAVKDPETTAAQQPSAKELPATTGTKSNPAIDSVKANTKQETSSTDLIPASNVSNGAGSLNRTDVATLEQTQAFQEETEEEKLAREAALINYELAREGLVATARLFEAFIQASAKGHLSVADKIGLELNRQLRELEAKLGHNSLLRPEFAHLCNALSDTQRSLALIRGPLIHNRIQAVLANRMGILDQQVPRIFIILPKPECPGEFRVHFLCECGEYDGSPKGKVPKHIHLTDHPGYDIQQKRQFMETYGTYMLDFLNLFKYGVGLDVMTMPPLDPSSKLLAQIHESMEYLLEVPSAVEPHNNGWLKDVAHCLQVNPRESCIGSLYRVVSQEGDTRWICREHYDHLQLNSLNDKFANIARGFKITYSDPHHSLFHYLLPDRTQAEQLYMELEQDPPIQDLGILLDWTITPMDLGRVLEVLKRLTTPVIRLFLQRSERPDDSLKASKDALYAHMLGNMTAQVFLMGEVAINFKRSEPRARLMRVRREMELKHGTRDMFTTLTIARDSQRRTNITLVYHSIERGLEMVKKHMGANFHLLIKLDVDTGDRELAKITFKNGDTVQLHLRALTPTSNYLLLSSLIRSLNVSIWEEHHVPELEKIIKRNQGMDSLDILGPRRVMVSAYNMIKTQFTTHPGLNKVTMKFDGITLSFSVDSSGEPVLELQTFVATGLDEIVSATAADLNVFFAQPSDFQAIMFEDATFSENVALEPINQSTKGSVPGTNGIRSSNSEVAVIATTAAASATANVSRLTMLNLDLSDLTRRGLESFARVIHNSPNLEKLDLRIYCSNDAKMDWEAFGLFMGRVSQKITGLLIKGSQFNSLLEQLVLTIPSPTTMLASLVVFEIRGAGELQTQTQTPGGDEHQQQQQQQLEQQQAVQWTSVERRYFDWINGVERVPGLTHLSFRQVWIDAAGWEAIMNAMNLFALIRVDIQDANFGTTQMDRLANLMGPDSLKQEDRAVDDEKAAVVVVNGKDKNKNGIGGGNVKKDETMSLFSIQLLCVFLCEAPDNDMLQRWDYLLKFRTNQLLYQCEMDPPIAQRTQTD